MTREQQFLDAVAARSMVAARVAAIVVEGDEVLVQRPTDDPDACFAFIGGGYELGDTFDSRIRAEFEQETTARVIDWCYLFVVENRFLHKGRLVQGIEHFLEVRLDRKDIKSREPHLGQHWLPVVGLREFDLRPHAVRDVVADETYRSVRHMIVPMGPAGPAGGKK